MGKRGITYRDAGVDIDAMDSVKRTIARKVRSTFSNRVLADIGLFGGLFDAHSLGMKRPVLVASVDGVGTKLKVASLMGVHSTVGRDLVAHCANDIAAQGARPLFFLDYIGFSQVAPNTVGEIVTGLATGCRKAGCALLGGETAQLPGVYQPGDYDLVGTIVGVVDRSKIIDGSRIRPGDVLIGLPSSGLHTNGYSLARKVLLDQAGLKLTDRLPGTRTTVGRELLKVHRDYSHVIHNLSTHGLLSGVVHITGGGFDGNIPRILPENADAVIRPKTWKTLQVFRVIQELGRVADKEMYRTFNMGIGLILVVPSRKLAAVREGLRAAHMPHKTIGEICSGRGTVVFD
ncbi:MAG: phosphoribosylformylglycinamidine cyclo-ligase [Verrucomicrobia bacterium]|nr:phosphoribosylformylglycinamidine cyclo-ligase [Verrucomicrobiota bacterium]